MEKSECLRSAWSLEWHKLFNHYVSSSITVEINQAIRTGELRSSYQYHKKWFFLPRTKNRGYTFKMNLGSEMPFKKKKKKRHKDF